MGISTPTEPIGWIFVGLNILLLIIITILPLRSADLSLAKFSDTGLRNIQLPKWLQWFHREYPYREQWLFKYAFSAITFMTVSFVTTHILHNDLKWYHQYPLYFWCSLWCFTLHQFKRCIEVLCVHKYSNNTMHFGTGLMLIGTYFVMGLTLSYGNVTNSLPPEELHNNVIIYVGLCVWFIGEIGNGACHMYLSWKRNSIGDNGYIPLRHLPLIFRVLVAPNMVFELVIWSGYCIIMRELNSLITLFCVTSYVGTRVYKTYQWYESHPDGTVSPDIMFEIDEDEIIGNLNFDGPTQHRKDTVSLHTSMQSVSIVQ